MVSYLQAAFDHVCSSAVKAEGFFVTLYENCPYYGGPEEGGWWGSDTRLVASQHFSLEEDADKAKEAVEKMAEDLTKQSRREHGQACLDSMEWLEARGLDADYLPEPDGESKFWVTVEKTRGECESTGSRHYE